MEGAGDRLRAILDEWKTIKGVDRKTDDALWKRFSKARDTFNRRAARTSPTWTGSARRPRSASRSWSRRPRRCPSRTTGVRRPRRYRDLMTEWKAAGRAPKEADDTLWQQFRAAQDKFFSRRSAVFNERDAELVDERQGARRSCSPRRRRSTRLATWTRPAHNCTGSRSGGSRSARSRASGSASWRASCAPIEEKVRSRGRRPVAPDRPGGQARAAQFRERVEQFEAQAAKARAAGDKRRAEQAEAQAAQWREWLAAAENAVASR